jgi:D-aspartate ligase
VRGANDDRANPPAERRGIFEAIERGERLRECLLREIVRLIVAPEEPMREPKHSRSVTSAQRFTRPILARARRDDELRVRRRLTGHALNDAKRRRIARGTTHRIEGTRFQTKRLIAQPIAHIVPIELVSSRRSPALLTMPEYCGTLAAARCLAEEGVRVSTASDRRFPPAAFSIAVARHARCPGLDRPDALVDWLFDAGARESGTVLYPTCDDFAWLQSVHDTRLRERFATYSPSEDVIDGVLDKKRLHEACGDVGIETPETHFPVSEDDAAALAARLEGPVLLKQRTQVLSRTHSKGMIVEGTLDLAGAFRRFVAENAHGRAVIERLPAASLPLVQAYFHEGVSGSVLVSGFVDETGSLFVARAARKVLQFPRTLGIALCLEAIDLDAPLARSLRDLCARIGYFGVFQIELLTVGERHLLIDFNPRYYHYLAFDIARGMPLPLMVQAAATRDRAELERLVASARTDRGPRAFSYRLQLEELLIAQRISGAMSATEAAHWREWFASHEGDIVDAVWHRDDRAPSVVDLATHVFSRVRHARSFVQKVALDR